jgi:hypothetical protein
MMVVARDGRINVDIDGWPDVRWHGQTSAVQSNGLKRDNVR